jgi:LysM repeat protein
MTSKSRRLSRFALAAALVAFAGFSLPQAASAQQTHPRCGDAVRVQPGNTLRQIAEYCGTTIASLMAANPQIHNPNLIHVGQVIRMPGRAVFEPPRAPAPQPLPPRHADTGPCGSRVTIRPGDTLFRIAMRCETTVRAILRANPQIEGPGMIRVGQVIRIPGAEWGPPRTPPGQHWQPPFTPVEARFTGTVTNEGVQCPSVRGDDGRLYTLTGDFGRLRPGERVRVTGHEARASICMQGTTIEVRQLQRLAGPTPPAPEPGLDITGTLTWEGVTCPAMRGDDGRLYTLAGDIRGFEPGDRVRVQGQRAQVSVCMQGTTLEVERIRAAR